MLVTYANNKAVITETVQTPQHEQNKVIEKHSHKTGSNMCLFRLRLSASLINKIHSVESFSQFSQIKDIFRASFE